MIEYQIKVTESERPVPIVEFEDKRFALLGEFLLAERSFRKQLLADINEVDLGFAENKSFSGNVFTLEIEKEKSRVLDDIGGRELELKTEDLKKITLDYIYTLRELSVKQKMAKHNHDGCHHH